MGLIRFYDDVILLTTLYKEHRERLFNYLIRMTGEYDLARDIMQESYTRCLERYGDSILSAALLYRIARNLVVDYIRKNSRCEPLEESQATDPKSLDHHLMIREEWRGVLSALEKLSLEDRELLSLVAVESLNYKDIAAIMDTTVGNIKVRIHRARKRLRNILVERERRREGTFN